MAKVQSDHECGILKESKKSVWLGSMVRGRGHSRREDSGDEIA